MNPPTRRARRATRVAATQLRNRIQLLGPLRVAATLGLLTASAFGVAHARDELSPMRSRSETAGANGARESDSTGPDLTPLQQALGPDEAAVATSPSLLPPRISVGDQVLILAGYRDDPLGDPAPGLDTSAPASGRVIGVEPTAVTLAVDLADLAEVAGPLVDGAATVVVVSADR